MTLQFALPPDKARELHPGSATPLSLKLTVPVGVPPLELTFAVRVIVCRKNAGLGDAVTVTVGKALRTTCGFVFSGPVDEAKFPLVEVNVAVMVWFPAARVLIVTLAWPEANVCCVPI
jgi:hypothetical protein